MSYIKTLMKLLFLHVPHTGGRVLKRILSKLPKDIDYVSSHNGEHFGEINTTGYLQYFILRPTLDRVIGQCLHYSRNLNQIGIVNYLRVESLPENYNIDNPCHFVNLEENRNLYCKFLLNRENFKIPITDTDYVQVLALFKGDNPPIWDMYSYPNTLTNLEKLLKHKIECRKFVQTSKSRHDRLFSYRAFINEIKQCNKYDIMLYNELTKPYHISKY